MSEHGSDPERQHYIDVGAVSVYEAWFPPHSGFAEHVHARPYVGFVLEGELTEATALSELTHRINSFAYHPQGLPHADRAGASGARILLIEIDQAQLARLLPASLDPKQPMSARLGQLRKVALSLSQELRASDPARATAIEGLSLDLVARALRLLESRPGVRSVARAAPPRWLADAYAFIDGHVDRRLSVQMIAEHLGIGRRDLSRAFRQHSGTSIRKYVHERLLSRAMTLLRESEMSIAEVAAASGFYDQAHLTTAIKRHTGMTPTSYRARNRVR